MDEKDLLNWYSLSIIISGNSENIRKNRIPAKYEKQVEIYLSALREANNKLRQYDIKHQHDAE